MRRATQLFGICWLLCLLRCLWRIPFHDRCLVSFARGAGLSAKEGSDAAGRTICTLDDASLSTYEQEAPEFFLCLYATGGYY